MTSICKSQPDKVIFEEYKNCPDGKDYQKENDIYKISSINLEIHLQRVLKPTLSPFDDK